MLVSIVDTYRHGRTRKIVHEHQLPPAPKLGIESEKPNLVARESMQPNTSILENWQRMG